MLHHKKEGSKDYNLLSLLFYGCGDGLEPTTFRL
jgi:hypothetical protein